MSLYINPCFLHWEWWSVRLRNGALKIWIWISTHAFLSTSAKWNIRKDISFWVSVFSFAIALSVWPPSRRYKIIVQQNIISKPTSFHLFPTVFDLRFFNSQWPTFRFVFSCNKFYVRHPLHCSERIVSFWAWYSQCMKYETTARSSVVEHRPHTRRDLMPAHGIAACRSSEGSQGQKKPKMDKWQGHSTGNYIQYPEINHDGTEYKKNVYVCRDITWLHSRN